MLRFLVRRSAYNVVVLIGVLFVVNALLLMAGDPATALLPLNATEEQKQRIRADLDLDKPLPLQFLSFLGRAVRGDFGRSHSQGEGALGIVFDRLPTTLQLGGIALLMALVVGLALGAAAALKPNTWVDHLSRTIAAFGSAVPQFWVGLMLMLLLGVRFGWLPISGTGGVEYLIMPAITVALPTIPPITRIFRSSLLGVVERDYIRTARAKGLSGTRIFRKHIARNASLPVLTVVGFQVSSILSSALVAEVIFAYPGMGRLAATAVSTRDLSVVQAFVFLASSVVLITNMLVDLGYALLDPRVRVR